MKLILRRKSTAWNDIRVLRAERESIQRDDIEVPEAKDKNKFLAEP